MQTRPLTPGFGFHLSGLKKKFAGFFRSKFAFLIRESICNIVPKAMVSWMINSAGLLVEKCLSMLETVSTAILVVDVMAL